MKAEIKNILKKLILEDTNDSAETFVRLKELIKELIPHTVIKFSRSPVKSVRKIRSAENEYVYDIGMKNEKNPWFFGNNILLHNSAYFSAYAVMKDLEEFKDYEWTKENVIDLYDKIADITNESFPDFMARAFNCPTENGAIIKAGRELCAVKGLFITKKRYAVLIFDKEGKRKDQNGKAGEIKAMGLDLKRSDTPKVVQDFLSDVLIKVLTGTLQADVIAQISEFREKFRSWQGWEKGSPKRANNITKYTNMQEQLASASMNNSTKRTTIPGHVVASLNWNKLKKIYGDHYSQAITDGAKVIVCKLKSNPAGINSIAYPVDQLTLPQWFKDLPFDHDAMEQALIDKKLDNLLSVLNWDLSASKTNNTFDSLFSF